MKEGCPINCTLSYVKDKKDIFLVTGLVFLIGVFIIIYGVVAGGPTTLALGCSILLGTISGTLGGLLMGRPFGWLIGLIVGLFGGVYLGLFIAGVDGAYIASFGAPISGIFSGWWTGIRIEGLSDITKEKKTLRPNDE